MEQKAHAHIHTTTKTVTETVTREVEVRKVVLTLTEREAETLAIAARMFVSGGSNERSRDMCAVRGALKEVGIDDRMSARRSSFYRVAMPVARRFGLSQAPRGVLLSADEFLLMFREGV